MVGKRLVRHALTKYGIPFGFPVNAKSGTVITCWQDLYTRNGDTEKLRKAILADKDCLLTISEIPANYMASLRLEFKRKKA